MIYLVLGFILIFYSYLEAIEYNYEISRFAFALSAILLILFAGLRDGTIVGTDSPAYYTNYVSPFWETEPGYKFINFLFSSKLNANYNVFLLFLNGFSIYLMCKFVSKNSVYLVLPFLIFYSDLYLYFNISGIRQGIAMSITCFAMYYAVRKKMKYFLFFIVCAAMFHVSSLIFIFAYFLPRKSLKFKSIIILVITFGVTIALVNFLGSQFEYLTKKLLFYSELQEKPDRIEILYLIGVSKRAIIIILSFVYRKYLFLDEKYTYLFNIYLIGFLIFVATYLISPDFGVRLSVYYTIVDCVLAGYMLSLVNTRSKRMLIVTVFSAIAIYKLLGYMTNEYYTYRFF
ncbi:MAG: EpsG family protein [Flavobacterium sp.]|uniref:EpsG family protein n=1 Tax=Flavobacterium sp. TaxID=239 RepID=UPI002615B71D|nr:EpsG family protein [Flavobacterium sp.]MDD5151452.1 EpsG family protein [Flavobacterium sp.]